MRSGFTLFYTIIFLLAYTFIQPAVIFTLENQLVDDALILDIDSTGYYDLVLWLNKLEINTTGSIEDLRNRLYEYYDVTPEIKNKTAGDGRSIIIESARALNYLKDITIDQNLIVLEGQVVLRMIDPSNKSTHKITADKITFNQTEKTISALGHIRYEIAGESNNELFYGESLVFEIENWEGIFFEGVSENDRVVDDKNISFFFSGDYIYRSSNDKIILNKGSITSSRVSDPYYRLDAEKIWVLQPGEWAIKNALLYVGRIPMLYIPFFFLPGDKLIFNPSAGYKETAGYFINTTTFLLGQKDETGNDTFSFLKSNNNTEIMKKERNGLFLTSTDKPVDMESWPYSTGSSIKLLGDYYSRKGFFLGLDGSLEFSGFLRQLNFFTAFSLSKYLFLDNAGNIYTPYRTDINGNYVSDYESSYFLGNKLPFRYAFDVDLNLGNSWMNFNINLPVYSDGQFRLHFMNREEGVKWTEFLDNNTTAAGTGENEINSMNWEFRGSLTPSADKLSPLIQEIALKKFNIQLTWLSAVLPFEDSSVLTGGNYSLEDNLSYFYPSALVIPDLSASISGTIFKSAENNSAAEDNISLESVLVNPISNSSKSTDLKKEESLLEIPEILGSIPIETVGKVKNFSNTLKYSIKPSVLVNSVFNTTPPALAEDTEFKSDYSILNSQITSILDYSFNLRESLLEFNNKTIFSMNYKQHFNPSSDIVNWDSLLLQDNNATNYKVSDNILIQSKPFPISSILNESVFSYSLGTVLYNRYYDQTSLDFTDDYFQWNESSINNHKASFELKYRTGNNLQILKIESVLPPGTTEFNPEVILTTGKLTGSARAGLKYREDGFITPSQLWTYDPVFLYMKYSFLPDSFFKQSVSLDPADSGNNFAQSELFSSVLDSKVSVNQKLRMNVSDFSFTESSTTLNLWFFNLNFLMEDVPGYDFQLPSGWIPSSGSLFQPSKASAGVNFKYDPDPFWKNRIRLSLEMNSSWTMNLQKYTDTSFNFGLNFTFAIAEFLDFTFESNSVNRATYRYIPGFSENLGLVYLNPVTDLLKSFNFFDTSDRLASNFNIETIGMTAVHHMKDWDLSINYSGKQDLVTNDSNRYEYEWKTEFSIYLTWRPIPEIKKNINYSENEISFE